MDDYTVKSVDKACFLLDVVSEYPQGITITELAAEVEMYKSTVHRLLTTLMRRGYIEQDAQNGKYKLGYRLLDLGMRLLSSIDLRKEAADALKQLANLSNEVVHLALMDRGEIVYIDKMESDNTTRMHSRIGKRVPVHATSLGKVILAFLPEGEAQDIVMRYGMPSLTEYTICDSEVFAHVLAETRELGYAFDLEENELGVCCVAAPVFDHNGQIAAACSVSGPSNRMTRTRLYELVPIVKDCARGISERLGHRVGQLVEPRG